MIKTIKIFTVVIISLVISSCSFRIIGELNPWYSYNKVESVSFLVKPDADLHFAIGIDVVFIYDQQTADSIAQIDGFKWFNQKQVMLMQYGSKLDLLERQMVPDYLQDDNELPKNHKNAIKVLAFMNYPGSNYTSVELTHVKDPLLVVEAKKLMVLPN